MKYLYYPGCSLKGSSRGYEESILAVFGRLQFPMEELDGWNCCGATAYMAVDEVKALALAARNLALAEDSAGSEPVSLVAPCNSCYLVLSKVQRYMQEFDEIGRTISQAMRQAGLRYRGDVHVRHPLDVLINDIGIDAIRQQAVEPLKGSKVACYYGCQMVRPYATFDDQYDPTTMDDLLAAMGAEPVAWRRVAHGHDREGGLAPVLHPAPGSHGPRCERHRHLLPALPIQSGMLPAADERDVRI